MTPSSKPRIAILISGRGSNMLALIQAAEQAFFPAEIGLVLSNTPHAEGLAIAKAHHIPTHVEDHTLYKKNRQSHEEAIHAVLKQANIELVCLAGYMRMLSDYLVTQWEGKMLNIHPSLLPTFPGLNTHKRALEAGVKIHGCSVHLVTEIMDDGPILGQAAVPVLPDDTEKSLALRVLEQEHKLYPRVIKHFIERASAHPKGEFLLNG
ncbi:phosphoribosylglycinamide formyltransferase [Entomobacter blattae]|uniref:Phosphoribosylglycinamide formyltransferase n=1 Tax=Entomobacter blattae TaxID=2762277 RepID=A0A7H1NRZ8_9PROT|nr:phosphoribosylglycinamide formyltransferase [Entomobacter blattae]QNT78558.1 Phosphoribosylglycinamide formyltransferase [Entomobacter blattae]